VEDLLSNGVKMKFQGDSAEEGKGQCCHLLALPTFPPALRLPLEHTIFSISLPRLQSNQDQCFYYSLTRKARLTNNIVTHALSS
jgi:hypothetical protein